MKPVRALQALLALSLCGIIGGCAGGGGEDLDAGVDGEDAGGDAGGDSSGDTGADPGGDGEDAADAVADCRFDPSIPWTNWGAILQMEGEGACVWLQRENLCPEGWVCKANPYRLLQIRIGHAGRVVEISEASQLSWTETWHNWEDVGEARTADTTYRLQGVEYGQQYDLSATGGESFGPLRLLPYAP